MGVEENKALAHRMFSDFANMMDYLADDVRWVIPGNAMFCGTYEGKADLLNRLLLPLRERLATRGPYELGTILGDGDHVVAQVVGTGRMTTDGKPYNNTYCYVLRLDNGKVVEVIEYCDTQMIADAFGPK